MKMFSHLWQYLTEFFLQREIFQTKFVEKTKTHISFSVTFLRKSCRLWDNVEKISYSQTSYRWQYNTARAICMLGKATSAHAHANAPANLYTHTHTDHYVILRAPNTRLLESSLRQSEPVTPGAPERRFCCTECRRNKNTKRMESATIIIIIIIIIIPRSRVLPEKLIGPQIVNKFAAFYKILQFITAFTRAHNLSLSWTRSIQSMPPSPTSFLEDPF